MRRTVSSSRSRAARSCVSGSAHGMLEASWPVCAMQMPVASKTVKPLGYSRCSESTSPLSDWRSWPSRSASRAQSSAVRWALMASDLPSCWRTSAFFAFEECSSRQNGPSPMLERRRCTTSSAAIFSETNSTVLPLARLCAIRLVMVWLLPVPGGPSSTRSRPASTAQIALSCDESASSGARMSCGRWVASSRSNSPGVPSRGKASPGWSIRCLTTRFCRSCSVRSCKSFHIRYLVNEKMPRCACSSTSHCAISRTASRKDCSTWPTSTPLSSDGTASRPATFSSKLVLSRCSSVGLTMASSSWRIRRKPLRTDWRCSVTGIRSSGARCTASELSASVQRSRPIAR